MPILNENTEHAFYCEGPSMTEQEHAERCSIPYQMDRIARGLNPNWGGQTPVRYGYEKMDNSITDHNIALTKQINDLQKVDLSELTDEQWNTIPQQTRVLLESQREGQKTAKKAKNDEKLKNDDKPPINDPKPDPKATP